MAVSYLVDLLDVPLTKNFAFGHAWGGSQAGACIDDTNFVYMESTLWHSNFSSNNLGPYFPNQFSSPSWGAPSSKVQIQDYIQQGVDSTALHFLWIGNNDVLPYTFYKGQSFITAFANAMTEQIQTLLDIDAAYILVSNIYPKHLAPVTPHYYGWQDKSAWDEFGTFIQNTNTAVQSKIAASFDPQKVLYYDVFAFMSSLWQTAASNGFSSAKDASNQWPSFCDGDTEKAPDTISAGAANNWDVCVTEQLWSKWFWMQYLDPTSTVHQMVAKDMHDKIIGHWGGSGSGSGAQSSVSNAGDSEIPKTSPSPTSPSSTAYMTASTEKGAVTTSTVVVVETVTVWTTTYMQVPTTA